MTRIGLISDTHGWLDEAVFKHFKNCNEIWHAGDFGNIEIAEQLRNFDAYAKQISFRAVYGNIDGYDVRSVFPEKQVWMCEDVTVFMTHIGGYPNRYAQGIKNAITTHKANLFISGHSHILKVMYDERVSCLHMNPGAAGKQGWHKTRTIIRFAIEGAVIKECEVIELGKR